jgi:hypothetical protein
MFWLLGPYAPFIWNAYLAYFEMSKKSKQKIRAYIFTCYVCPKSFHEKSTRLACVKKTKIGARNKAFYETCFIFLHRTQKISVFRITLRMHIDCGDVHAKSFAGIFWRLEIYFLVEGAYAHGSRIEFLWPFNLIEHEFNLYSINSLIR